MKPEADPRGRPPATGATGEEPPAEPARPAGAAAMLQVGDEWFRRLAETTAAAIVIVQGAGIRYVNGAVEAATGYTRDELLAMSFWELAHPVSQEMVRDWGRACQRGEVVPSRYESRVMTRGGEERWWELAADLIELQGVPAMLWTGHDVTERRRLREQLARARRLEMAGLVAGQVAHDLNNLMMPLMAYPRLVRMRLPPGHPAVALCNAMLEAAQQIADIMEDLMALGRRGRLELRSVDLNQVARQAVQRLPASSRGVRVELELATNLLPVEGSPAQLLRAVTNLLANACEAVREAGLVVVRSENVLGGRNLRGCEMAAGEYVRLTVADDGPGVAPEIRERIFELFFTTKATGRRRGSGLGLSVVEAVVSDHGGCIDLESEVGKGAAFRVYLPASSKTWSEEQVGELPRGDETVLIADDDELQRNVVRGMLETLGYRVETVGSGAEAVAHLESGGVDLLILDMLMPPGIDGLESYRRVLEVRPGQRAILLSGLAEGDRIERTLALGAGAYLRKPVTLERLARAVRDELDRGSPTRQG